ncbi:MAG: protein kinase [Anaerolineales bacterium]|nr:protein kinase [Anaerolineales bacterium]
MTSNDSLFKSYEGLIIDDKYELIRFLGAGSFGAVYEAQHLGLGVKRALKFLVRQLESELASAGSDPLDWSASNDQAIAEAQQEAQALVALKHPNILTVHDLEVAKAPHQKLIYIVMDYADGGSLQDKLENGPLSPGDAEKIFSQVCAALDYAHNQEVIHLDLKPLNILLDKDGNALVCDFGLAQYLAAGKTHVSLGGIAGTFGYAPPEQLISGKVGRYSDIFALGATLHHMLTGSVPERTVSLGLKCSDALQLEMRQIIEKAGQPLPKHRYTSAEELAQALSVVLHPSTSTPAIAPAPVATIPASLISFWLAAEHDRLNALDQYLKDIEANLKAGNATEHTHRPALKKLIEAYAANLDATNEPKHEQCGAPDFAIALHSTGGAHRFTIGYVETKNIGIPLDKIEKSDQLKRYLRSLGNLILTDYLEFRWYVDGSLYRRGTLAYVGNGNRLKRVKKGDCEVDVLLQNFIAHAPQPVDDALMLAQHMARLTHLIRDIASEALKTGKASPLLVDLRHAFAQVLVPDMDDPKKVGEFADMYAQTLAYGLFAARCNHQGLQPFQRSGAAVEIPKTNPLLRHLFDTITGPDLDDEPYVGFVDDLTQLLANADIDAILSHFGRRASGQDPIMHFYETFLAAYDPRLREKRGVYYTPDAVVSYITRSVDYLLKTDFKLPAGLADTATISQEQHRVLVLDPATGTGTFLYHVIDQIRHVHQQAGNAGMWPGYVRQHLLPRLYGFELLAAPYAVAHLKLGLQLAAQDLDPAHRANWAYNFSGDERVNVFLTNTLEDAEREITSLFGPYRVISEEAKSASSVKKDMPIMVILGNPPYSGHSANRSDELTYVKKGSNYIAGWKVGNDGRAAPVMKKATRDLPKKKQPTFIGRLVRDYYFVDGKPLGEKNPKWLQDDYVKFIRWAQWRIERTGSGILAFITNHSYLDNPTFRGMRQSLLQTFDEIYVLNLHGNTKKRETSPGGGKDENVFEIQQGVAIGIFVKRPDGVKGEEARLAQVHHADYWGVEQSKTEQLMGNDISTTGWDVLTPEAPFYLLVPQDTGLRSEYEPWWQVVDIFPKNSVGIVTGHDNQTIAFERDDAKNLAADFNLPVSVVQPILYRPFDERFIVYDKKAVTRPRSGVMLHMLAGSNIGLVVPKRVEIAGPWQHVIATNKIIEHVAVSLKTIDSLFPLYVYPDEQDAEKKVLKLFNLLPWSPGEGGRVPNFNPEFISNLEVCLDAPFEPDPPRDQFGDLIGPTLVNGRPSYFIPEDVFGYIYAIMYSPTYRNRYAEFLKLDFPRIPITSDADLFWSLSRVGQRLAALHTFAKGSLPAHITSYPVRGNDVVAKAHPIYANGRVYINPGQYFDGVPEDVWKFVIGGYQVCEKWLKEQRGRVLLHDDLTTFQNIVVVIRETIELMRGIDASIKTWPIR